MPVDFLQGLADGLEDDPTQLIFDSPRTLRYLKGEKAGKARRASLRGVSAGLRHNIRGFESKSKDFRRGFIVGNRKRLEIVLG
jgi:hypothetical protein